MLEPHIALPLTKQSYTLLQCHPIQHLPLTQSLPTLPIPITAHNHRLQFPAHRPSSRHQQTRDQNPRPDKFASFVNNPPPPPPVRVRVRSSHLIGPVPSKLSQAPRPDTPFCQPHLWICKPPPPTTTRSFTAALASHIVGPHNLPISLLTRPWWPHRTSPAHGHKTKPTASSQHSKKPPLEFASPSNPIGAFQAHPSPRRIASPLHPPLARGVLLQNPTNKHRDPSGLRSGSQSGNHLEGEQHQKQYSQPCNILQQSSFPNYPLGMISCCVSECKQKSCRQPSSTKKDRSQRTSPNPSIWNTIAFYHSTIPNHQICPSTSESLEYLLSALLMS